ncbi:hypothetical protein [Synechococcus sp. PCC 6312]|uniref:hypothetical protein n=1 Tax=Synechococcus sp. (strain ATCC 27167 / PCC 6312) TaxID=195253 RepID=UPI00029ED4E5|nr:hypothetical protein [Synechococcus sp. PCC 6312]AFY60329.1 hypothetical protein Syn6312_1140 [Synechococcus sp. PCC 6312]
MRAPHPEGTIERELTCELFRREVLGCCNLRELRYRLLWTHKMLLSAYDEIEIFEAELSEALDGRERDFRRFIGQLDELCLELDRLEAVVDPQGGAVEALLLGGDCV